MSRPEVASKRVAGGGLADHYQSIDLVRHEIGASDSKAVDRSTVPVWQVHLRDQVCGENPLACTGYVDHFRIEDGPELAADRRKGIGQGEWHLLLHHPNSEVHGWLRGLVSHCHSRLNIARCRLGILPIIRSFNHWYETRVKRADIFNKLERRLGELPVEQMSTTDGL